MGICKGKGKGSGGESGSGEFRVKCWVSWMGEGAEEELGSGVGYEASGVGGFVLIGVKVEGERDG